jgi:hypothetical protein
MVLIVGKIIFLDIGSDENLFSGRFYVILNEVKNP